MLYLPHIHGICNFFFCAEDIIGADMVQFGKFYDVSGREWQFVELIEGISLLGDAVYIPKRELPFHGSSHKRTTLLWVLKNFIVCQKWVREI